MNKAVFIDRDGVINSDEGFYYVFDKENFITTPQLGQQLKRLQDAGYLLIVITNQGGVARGEYSIAHVEVLNEYLRELMLPFGVHITEVYACPHHSDHSTCLCRKPQPLMVQKALARFNIDPSQSYFIGDRDSDMLTAKRAGVTGVKVEVNKGILNAVDKILG